MIENNDTGTAFCKVGNLVCNQLINIYYACFTEQLPEKVFHKYLCLLPTDQRDQNQRYVRWQDRYLHLYGKLLLIEGLKHFGLSYKELNNLKYNKNDKPFLKKSSINFNISHSGNYAICAICDNIKIGIDIEGVKPINFNNFKRIFTKSEWAKIEHSNDPFLSFFTFWTRKESVIKADGRGLSIPLDNIDVVEDIIVYDSKIWYIKELEIINNYRFSLASNIDNVNIRVIKIDFFK